MSGIIRSAIVVKHVIECSNIASIYLRPINARIPKPKPGQFIMLWVPGLEEIPMSISGFYGDVLRVTVKARGSTTKYLVYNVHSGTFLGFKGPLGRGIDPAILKGKRVLAVAGGIGIAPIAYLLHELRDYAQYIHLAYGVRTANELVLLDEVTRLCHRVSISTDDGSKGYRGTVVDIASDILRYEVFDVVVVAGPREVLDEVSRICIEKKIHGWVFAESIFKCGIGACGSCSLGKYILCRDGPVLSIEDYWNVLRCSK